MLESQKHVFWQALLVAIFIFGVGIVLGIVLENWRTSKISNLADLSQIDLLDIQLQNEIYSTDDFNCESAVRENINFAERIYEEAKVLDRYEKASRLTRDLKIQHKKYDLLRAMLLINSIKIRETCDDPYQEIVYFYKYNEPDMETKARQNVFSKMLMEVKEEKGAELLLIPIAGDNDLSSVNLILDSYGIALTELPVILINGKKKITEVQSVDEILGYLDVNDADVIRL